MFRDTGHVTVFLVTVGILMSALGPVAATPATEPPLAEAGLDQQVPLDSTVILDATGSRDPDGGALEYEWTIETPSGTTIVPDCPRCARTEFRAARPGRYEATVTVTDEEGHTTKDTLYVEVEEAEGTEAATPAPTAPPAPSPPPSWIGGPGTAAMTERAGPEGAALTATPDAFQIEGPATVAAGEDATFEVAQLTGLNDPRIAWSVEGQEDIGWATSRTFSQPGTYFVSAAASDGDTTLRDTLMVEVVANRPPRVTLGVQGEVQPGKTVQVVISNKSDPDGIVEDTAWSRSPFVDIHRSENSETTVSVTVTDDDGATATDEVTIETDFSQVSEYAEKHITCYVRGKAISERVIERCTSSTGTVFGSGDSTVSQAQLDRWREQGISTATITLGADIEVETTVGEAGMKMDSKADTREGTLPEVEGATQAEVSTMTPFSNNGKTVSSDLNGDGSVNAIDWDRKYGSTDNDERSNREERQDLSDHAETRKEAEHVGSSTTLPGGSEGGGSGNSGSNDNEQGTSTSSGVGRGFQSGW